MFGKLIASALLIVFSVNVAQAEEAHVAPIMAKLPEIKKSIVNDTAISTIKAGSASRSEVTEAEVEKLEAQWKSELDSGNLDLIASVTQNPLADHLRSVVEASGGFISEINVMDANGFSVGQSSPNSDIYQGEEGKYRKTYLKGPDVAFVDEVEFDDSTQTDQSQVNFTVVDPASGKAIGAVSVGIDVSDIVD